MKITYIAQYASIKHENEQYLFSPAGVTKMEYFLYCFRQLGIPVSVFSFCLSRKKRFRLPHKSKTRYGQAVTHALTFKPIRGLSIIVIFILQIQLFIRLVFSGHNEVFFIYHERFYSAAVKIARIFRKKLRIILDVEEIYSICAQLCPQAIKKEIDYLKSFDKYILANINLAPELKLSNNQYIVCNGVYAPLKSTCLIKNQATIHVLYAGTFDQKKGGAKAAIKAFELLDDKYRLHLCGFGSEEQINELNQIIADINRRKGYQAIIYEGFIPTKHYEELLNNCTIGLSTQTNTGKYNAVSFPSKTFEYLRYGLKVVSSRIPGIENLPISSSLVIIDSNSPENIAQGIEKASQLHININHCGIIQMHQEFIQSFQKLFDK